MGREGKEKILLKRHQSWVFKFFFLNFVWGSGINYSQHIITFELLQYNFEVVFKFLGSLSWKFWVTNYCLKVEFFEEKSSSFEIQSQFWSGEDLTGHRAIHKHSKPAWSSTNVKSNSPFPITYLYLILSLPCNDTVFCTAASWAKPGNSFRWKILW